MKKTIRIQKITMIGLLAAMVYVSSAFLQISIPIPLDNTRLHMGNVLCLLSGLLLGPVSGGLAAGIGSMVFDLTNPLYLASAPFTFVFKFAMAWVCGYLYIKWKKREKKLLTGMFAAACGSLTYIILYLTKGFFELYVFLELDLDAVIVTTAYKGLVSLVNGIIAVVVAVPLSMAIRPAIVRLIK